jgi:hypothetical protein
MTFEPQMTPQMNIWPTPLATFKVIGDDRPYRTCGCTVPCDNRDCIVATTSACNRRLAAIPGNRHERRKAARLARQ